MAESLTDILKNRRERGRYDWLGLGLRLVNLVQPVGLHVLQHRPRAGAPKHLESVRLAREHRKNAQRIVAAQVPPTGHYFLRQDTYPVGQANAGANTKPVAASPAQPHRHPWLAALVAVQPRRLVQVVDHHVLIAVVVEISQRHPVRHANVIEPPVARCRRKP